MENYTVLYFTGTGNARYAAKKISALTGGELINLNEKIKCGDISPVETAENIVIATPTYCWRIPRVVSDLLSKIQLQGAKRAWFVMVCGSDIGNAEAYNSLLCYSLGIEYMGTAEIIMPENYIAMFNAPNPDTAKKIIADANPIIDKLAENIRAGKCLDVVSHGIAGQIKSGPINPLFYKFSVKSAPFTAGDKCISCGKCATLCPTNSITLVSGKPVWGENCTHCMACICHCPTEAIEYGRKSIGKPRYHLD